MDDVIEKIIYDDMVCSGCISKEEFGKLGITGRTLETLVRKYPALNYVKEQFLNYMFANGLTCGHLNGDDELKRWLYTTNEVGVTNYQTLRDVVGNSAVYGECGIRSYNGNFYEVKKGHYAYLTYLEDGIEKIMYYFVRKDGEYIDKDFDYKGIKDYVSLNKTLQVSDLYNYFDDNGYILLDKTQFASVRNNTSYLHGDSIFNNDLLRHNLVMNVYNNLNADAKSRPIVILRPSNAMLEGDDIGNEVSTSSLVNANLKDTEEYLREAKRVAKEFKKDTTDSVTVISNAFKDKIERFDRAVKATEYLGWLENEGVIIAEAMGMPPSLLELGKVSGNVSMEKIIDNSMINSIVPTREKYAIQFSPLIVSTLQHNEINKIFFDKYEMQQTESDNQIREQVATTIQKIGVAIGQMKNAEVDVTLLKGVADDLANQIKQSLYDENNQLKEMTTKLQHKDKVYLMNLKTVEVLNAKAKEM